MEHKSNTKATSEIAAQVKMMAPVGNMNNGSLIKASVRAESSS
jgi:hypothetical protein